MAEKKAIKIKIISRYHPQLDSITYSHLDIRNLHPGIDWKNPKSQKWIFQSNLVKFQPQIFCNLRRPILGSPSIYMRGWKKNKKNKYKKMAAVEPEVHPNSCPPRLDPSRTCAWLSVTPSYSPLNNILTFLRQQDILWKARQSLFESLRGKLRLLY